MRVDPRLRMSAALAEQITAMRVADGAAFLTDAYPFPLVAEMVGDELQLRAATGEEVTALLTTGDVPSDDEVRWPGDPAQAMGREIEWQLDQISEPVREAGCRLWAGEVLLSSGQGSAGPFYIHELAAAAWAFCEALKHPPESVFEIQVVPYACARSFAPALLRDGDMAFRGFRRRYAAPPIQPGGAPVVLALPRASLAK